MDSGSFQMRVTFLVPGVAVGLLGALERVRGVRLTGLDDDPAPRLLIAVTVSE